MHPLIRSVLWALLLIAESSPAFSQLRNLSPYSQDRINREQTFFRLRDSNTAEFAWASEWTHGSAYAFPEKSIIFLWHFKDGSVAYSQQGESLDDAGKTTDYLLAQKSDSLEDKSHKKIQPATLTNYPIRVELWLGEAANPDGFKPEMLFDAICLEARSLEYNRDYHFTNCSPSSAASAEGQRLFANHFSTARKIHAALPQP